MSHPMGTNGMMMDFDWVDSSVVAEIDKTFSSTFSRSQDSRLQLKRLRGPTECGGDVASPHCLLSNDISTKEELQSFAVRLCR